MTQNLPEYSQNTSLQTTQGNSISIYRDSFNVSQAINQFAKLKQAFPQLPTGFYDVLLDRIKDKGFTDQRLKDAINNLIDNFTYPVPTIANVVSFDKRIKLYTYSDLTDAVSNGRNWKDFTKVKRNGKTFWITVTDKETYNIGGEI